MRDLRKNTGAQAALVDAILFMAVMLLATAVIVSSSGFMASTERDKSGIRQYSADFSGTLLALELADLSYIDTSGHEIGLGAGGRSIARLLCDEAIILDGGNSNFSAYNTRILDAGNALIRPGLDFAVSCCDGSIFISNPLGELPDDRFASQLTVRPADSPEVTITVYVWVV